MPFPLIAAGLLGLGGLTFLKSDQAQPTKAVQPRVVNPLTNQPSNDLLESRTEFLRDKQETQQGTSMAEIMARLEALQNPERYMSDLGMIDSQARMSASSRYDPILAQLRSAQGAAQSRGNRYSAELGNMFTGLSNELSGHIPQVQQQFQEYKDNTQQQYDKLEGNINQQYEQSQADQEAIFRRLNIEAAAETTAPEQLRDRDFFLNNTRQNAQVQQSAIDTEGRGNVEFTRRGSELATVEGKQRQGDLRSQLMDIMAQYDSKIAESEAAKQSSYSQALAELQSGNMSEARKYVQQDFDNYLSSIRLGRELQKDTGSVYPKAVSSPADVAGRALGLGLNQNDARVIQDSFMSSLGDPYILAGYNTSTGLPTSKEALASRVLEIGRQNGMTQQQLNALHTAALEYFGRQ